MQDSQGDGSSELKDGHHACDQDYKLSVQVKTLQELDEVIQHLNLLYLIKKDCQSQSEIS